jgi:hypothetical protein
MKKLIIIIFMFLTSPVAAHIITVEKEVVVEKLKLPDWIKTDENKQVVATAEIVAYKGKTDAVAILDTKTGASEIVAKQVPLPLVGFENDKELGLRAGVSLKGSTEVGCMEDGLSFGWVIYILVCTERQILIVTLRRR